MTLMAKRVQATYNSPMSRLARRPAISILQITLLSGISSAAFGEEMQHDHAPPDRPAIDHSQMDHSKMDHSKMDHTIPAPAGSASKPAARTASSKRKPAGHSGHATSAIPATDHSQMDHGAAGHGMSMKGFFGPY